MESSTQQKILDVAQGMVQSRGFNAFSYRDLTNEIGIKTSSIHYYFPSKDDLGEALVKRYQEIFRTELKKIDLETNDAPTRVKRYVELFMATMKQDGKICLCGMLASDYFTLSEKVQSQVREFFIENEIWLTRVLSAGKETGAFDFVQQPEEMAKAFFATLEGAMLSARLFADENRLETAADCWQSALR